MPIHAAPGPMTDLDDKQRGVRDVHLEHTVLMTNDHKIEERLIRAVRVLAKNPTLDYAECVAWIQGEADRFYSKELDCFVNGKEEEAARSAEIVEIIAYENGQIACTDVTGEQVPEEQEPPLVVCLRDKLARGIITEATHLFRQWADPTTVGLFLARFSCARVKK